MSRVISHIPISGPRAAKVQHAESLRAQNCGAERNLLDERMYNHSDMSPSDFGFRMSGGGRLYSIRPWVGERYWSEDLRIIVHGDSYYATEGSNSMLEWQSEAEIEGVTERQISDVIEAYRGGAGDSDSSNLRDSPFYSGVVQAIMCKSEITSGDVASAFGRIAFNNYVHVPMPTPNASPEPEQYEAARHVYMEELTRLKPHLSLVFAKRVWDNLPNVDEKFTGCSGRDMCLYKIPSGKVLVGWLRHPSTRWRYNGWRDEVEINVAKEYFRIARNFHGIE
jgi:hypothetical protein